MSGTVFFVLQPRYPTGANMADREKFDHFVSKASELVKLAEESGILMVGYLYSRDLVEGGPFWEMNSLPGECRPSFVEYALKNIGLYFSQWTPPKHMRESMN